VTSYSQFREIAQDAADRKIPVVLITVKVLASDASSGDDLTDRLNAWMLDSIW
jgi:hypothetical protein